MYGLAINQKTTMIPEKIVSERREIIEEIVPEKIEEIVPEKIEEIDDFLFASFDL